MNQVSQQSNEKARKYLQLSLQRISSVGQNHIAEQLGLSGPTVCRFVADDLERACLVLAAAGLKVVPVEMRCYEPRKIAILMELARDHLNQLDGVEQLSFE